MSEAPPDLAPEAIAAALTTLRYGRSLEVRAETGSTNDDARAAAAAGAADGHTVVADHQRSGRGARGRTWSSPAGTDLYVSIVSRVRLAPQDLPPLTLAVGLGLADAVAEQAPGSSVTLKWPNDVHLDGAKCAGVLVESVSMGGRLDSVVIGIGLDVNRIEFDPSLEDLATSLARRTGRTHPRARVLASVLGHVEATVDRLVSGGPAAIVAGIEPRLAWRGERVRCEETEGVLEGLAPDGGLRLRTDEGATRVLRAGTLRRV